MKIVICICGLTRSISLVIENFTHLFKEHSVNFIISTSDNNDTEYLNNNNDVDMSNNIIKFLKLKDYDYNDYRNSENYSNKITNAINIIPEKYDLYIVARSDLILNEINLGDINTDKLYFSNTHTNNYSNNYSKNELRVSDNIIITKNYNLLVELIDLHKYNQKNKNYLDINLFHYIKQKGIEYELINIKYKLILSKCNIIAISGDSGSGKTTLSKTLTTLFKTECCLLETDRYHKWERGDMNYKKYSHLNPQANHLERMNEDVFQYKIGNDIYQVDYDHSSGKFTQKQKIYNKDNLVLCGLHTLYQENMNELLNLKIYLDTDRELIKKWKIQRDVNERGYSLEKVLKQIENREKDYNEYIIKQKDYADIVIQFYEIENELQCNFIIQNNVVKEKTIDKIIQCDYKITYDNGNNLIIQLKKSVDFIDEQILNIIENNIVLFRNNYFKEIINLINFLI